MSGQNGAVRTLDWTWSVSDTLGQAMTFPRELIRAATTDNIQPMVLLACEAFGATLPMCERTRMIMEREASRRGTSAMLDFIQAQVGWSGNDAAAYLACSDAGLRFLGLAAALTSAGQEFESARSLQQLLKVSYPANDTSLPTLGQLEDLITALAPKILLARFAERVVGASVLLRAVGWSSYTCPIKEKLDQYHPSVAHVEHLVTALRRLARIGETEAETYPEGSCLVISSAVNAAWIYSFVEWIIGSPPSITDNTGECIFGHGSESQVVLIINRNADAHYRCPNDLLKIEFFETIDQLAELWESESRCRSWYGFLSIEASGRLWRSCWNEDQPSTYHALSEGISILLQAFHKQIHDRFDAQIFESGLSQWMILPPLRRIKAVFMKILGSQATFHSRTDYSVKSLSDLPLVKHEMERLKNQCQWPNCHRRSSDSCCSAGSLLSAIWLTSIDILALSLLPDNIQETVMVNLISLDERGGNNADQELYEEIRLLSKDLGRTLSVNERSIASTVFKMLGNEPDPKPHRQWLVKARLGQVAYFSFLEGWSVPNTCLCELTVIPGQMRHRSELITTVRGDLALLGSYDNTPQIYHQADASNGCKVGWMIGRREKNELNLRLFARGSQAYGPAFPEYLLRAPMVSLWLESCPHNADDPLGPDEATLHDASRLLDLRRSLVKEDNNAEIDRDGSDATNPEIHVIDTENIPGLRMWVLSEMSVGESVQYPPMQPMVIRGNACLKCAVDACRKTGWRVVLS